MTLNPVLLPRPRVNVPVWTLTTHGRARTPSKSSRKPRNSLEAARHESRSLSRVMRYGPRRSRSFPMLSSFSTWNVPGQRSPVGCVPLPPPLGLGGPTSSLDAEAHVARAAQERAGLAVHEPRPRQDAVEVLEEAREVRGGLGTGEPAGGQQRYRVAALRDGERPDAVVVQHLEGARTGRAIRVVAASPAAVSARREPS